MGENASDDLVARRGKKALERLRATAQQPCERPSRRVGGSDPIACHAIYEKSEDWCGPCRAAMAVAYLDAFGAEPSHG